MVSPPMITLAVVLEEEVATSVTFRTLLPPWLPLNWPGGDHTDRSGILLLGSCPAICYSPTAEDKVMVMIELEQSTCACWQAAAEFGITSDTFWNELQDNSSLVRHFKKKVGKRMKSQVHVCSALSLLN